MATYKVLQDIEAEDKLLGPLSLRQFIYAVIVVVLGFISFRLFFVQPLLVIPLILPMVLFGILAAPFGHDQSSEIWLLAKVRFAIKPRTRIWDQDGLLDLVTVTAPKKIARQLTNNLDQTQVRSRLQALAQTIDTRGWAIKGVEAGAAMQPVYTSAQDDRLIDIETLASQQVSDIQIEPSDDFFDSQNNPLSQHMNELMQNQDQQHRQQILDRMEQIRRQQAEAAQTKQPAPTPIASTPPTPYNPTLDEQRLLNQVHRSQALAREQTYGNTKVLQPTHPQHHPSHKTTTKEPTNPTPTPAIIKETAEAPKHKAAPAKNDELSTNKAGEEVVISLH